MLVFAFGNYYGKRPSPMKMVTFYLRHVYIIFAD